MEKKPPKKTDPKLIRRHFAWCCLDGQSGRWPSKWSPHSRPLKKTNQLDLWVHKIPRLKFPLKFDIPNVMDGWENVWIRLQIWCHFGVWMLNFGIGVIPNHQLQHWKWPCPNQESFSFEWAPNFIPSHPFHPLGFSGQSEARRRGILAAQRLLRRVEARNALLFCWFLPSRALS